MGGWTNVWTGIPFCTDGIDASQMIILNRFCIFYKSVTNQRTNGPTDRWTDKAAGYDKVPKHASIACRQQANFVGRETGKRMRKRQKREKKRDFSIETSKLFMAKMVFI